MQIENLHMYLFVRQDISLRQQSVQSNHVSFLAGRVLASTTGTPNLVYIGVPDQAALRAVMGTCMQNGILYEKYEEPDGGMGLSAVITTPVSASQRPIFSGFKTWRPIELAVQGQTLPLAPKFTRRTVLKALCGVESLRPAPQVPVAAMRNRGEASSWPACSDDASENQPHTMEGCG